MGNCIYGTPCWIAYRDRQLKAELQRENQTNEAIAESLTTSTAELAAAKKELMNIVAQQAAIEAKISKVEGSLSLGPETKAAQLTMLLLERKSITGQLHEQMTSVAQAQRWVDITKSRERLVRNMRTNGTMLGMQAGIDVDFGDTAKVEKQQDEIDEQMETLRDVGDVISSAGSNADVKADLEEVRAEVVKRLEAKQQQPSMTQARSSLPAATAAVGIKPVNLKARGTSTYTKLISDTPA